MHVKFVYREDGNYFHSLSRRRRKENWDKWKNKAYNHKISTFEKEIRLRASFKTWGQFSRGERKMLVCTFMTKP